MGLIIFLFLILQIVAYGVTVEQIINNHPEIKAIQKKIQSYQQRAAYEKSLPDPVVSFSIKDVQLFYRPFDRDIEPMQAFEVGISQYFPLKIKREKKAEIFYIKKDAYLCRLLNQKQEYVYQVYKKAYKIWEIQQKLNVISEFKKLAKDLMKLTDTLYSVGKVSQSEVFDVQYFYSQLLEKEIFLKRKKEILFSQLTYFTGKDIQLTPEKPEKLQDLKTFLKKAEDHNPLICYFKQRLKESKTRVELARLEYKPDFRFFGSYSFRDGYRDYVSVGLSFNIPVWRKSRQDVKLLEEISLKEKQNHQLKSIKKKVKSDLQAVYYKAVSHYETYNLLQDVMIHQTKAVFDSIISEYQVGEKNIFDVIKAINQILNVKIRTIEEISEYNIALKDIQRLTGEIR